MGMGRRAMVYLGLAEEDEGYIDDEYEAEEPVREPVAARPARRAEQREIRELRETREREVRMPEVSTGRRGRHEVRGDLAVEPIRGSVAPRLADPVAHETPDPSASYQI